MHTVPEYRCASATTPAWAPGEPATRGLAADAFQVAELGFETSL
jgi:hypothetical protein